MTTATETKVGIFVVTAAVALSWLLSESGSLPFSSSDEPTRILTTEFTNAKDLKAGSPVKMAGVQIGEVSRLYLNGNGKATIELAVKENVPLPASVQARITSNGLIGENFITLAATTFEDDMLLASEAERIPSAYSSSMDDIVSTLSKIGDRLDQLLTQEVEEGKVRNIVNNLEEFTNKLNGEGGLLVKLMENDGQMIDDLEVAMANLKEITGKVNEGDGTLGRLINDPAVSEKIETALDSFSEVTGRLEAFRTEVDFNGYMLASEDVGKGHFNIKFQPRLNRYYVLGITGDGFATEAADARSTVGFRGEEFGDDLKFTLQFGHMFENVMFGKDMGFRIGVKDSTFGIGTDMTFGGGRVELATDIYDFTGENSGSSEEVAHIDLTAKVNLLDKTLYAIGGYDNLLNQKYGSPFLGLGFRFLDDDFKYLMANAPGL